MATLLAFQLTSGSGSGAFAYPGSPGPDLLATYQAVPAVAGVDQPFNLAITTSSLPGGTVYTRHAAEYSAQLTAGGGSAPYTWKLVSGLGDAAGRAQARWPHRRRSRASPNGG